MNKRNIHRILRTSNTIKKTDMQFAPVICGPGFLVPGIVIYGEEKNVYSPLIRRNQPLLHESDIFSVKKTDRSGFHKGTEKRVMPRPKKFDPKSCGKSQVTAVPKDPIETGKNVQRNGDDAYNRVVERLIGNELAEILIKYPDFFHFILGSLMIERSYLYGGKLVTGDYLCECLSNFLKETDYEIQLELSDPESVLNAQMVALFNKFQQYKYFLD